MASWEKNVRTVMSVMRTYLMLATSSNDSLETAGPAVTKYNASKKNVLGKFPILSLDSKYLQS